MSVHTSSLRTPGTMASPFAPAAVIVGLLALILGVTTVFVPDLVFLTVGVAALFIVLVPPALSRQYDFCSPWSYLSLCAFLGLTVRGIYITLRFPDRDTLDSLYFLGERPDFFLFPAAILIGGLLIIALSYALRASTPPRRVPRRHWNMPRLYFLAVCALIISTVGTLLYIKATGGHESDLLSAKRTKMSHHDADDANYGANGVLLALSSLAMFAHLLVLADVLRKSGGARGLKIVLALALFFTACWLPFYGSDRSSIAINALAAASMLYYSGRSFPFVRILTIGLLLLVAIHVMTVLRGTRAESVNMDEMSMGPDLISSAVLNRNYIGLGKTAHVISAVPHSLEVQYGNTMFVWLAAPIPRDVWPEKPVVQSGPIVGEVVYGNRRSGVPPGFVAELYWNFKLPGVFFGCLLLGLGMRYLYDRFRPVRGGDMFVTALYVCGPMQFGFDVLGHSLGSGAFQLFMRMSVMGVFLWFIRDRRIVTARDVANSDSTLGGGSAQSRTA